jgi:hypothetical protein
LEDPWTKRKHTRHSAYSMVSNRVSDLNLWPMGFGACDGYFGKNA